MSRCFAAFLCAACLLLARRSAADEPAVVVVLVSPGSEALAARVGAELHALGFTVKREDAQDVSVASLAAAARGAGAAAAIRVVRSDQKAEVWVADRVTGKTLLRTIEVGADEDPNGLLAVRAVELLRASLLEVEAAHPSRGEVKPGPVVRRVAAGARPARPRRSSFALAVGFGPQLAPGLSPSFHAMVAMAWMPSHLGLEATLLVPVFPANVCAAQGCASVSSGLLAAGLRVALAGDRSRFHPEIGAGFAGAFVHADGKPTGSYVGTSANAALAVAYARLGLTVSLNRHARLGLDSLVGAGLPPVPVRFAGQDVARWGAPFASLLLRTEVWFP